MKISESVSLRKLQQDAEDNFRNGYFCCEALVAAVRNNFDLDISDDVIKMSSGMAVGVGKSGCICGALNGGVLALGLFFGRSEQSGPGDPKVVKCLELNNELHDWFKVANGKNTNCCRILTREFDMKQGEHKEQCIYFTGLAAWKVGEIVCRELGVENTDVKNNIPSLDEELKDVFEARR